MQKKNKKHFIRFVLPVFILFLLVGTFAVIYTNKTLPNIYLGALAVGGLEKAEARMRIQEHILQFSREGVTLNINGSSKVIPAASIGFKADLDATVDEAFTVGRSGPVLKRLLAWSVSMFRRQYVDSIARFEPAALEQQLDIIGVSAEQPKLDVRLQVTGLSVKAMTDTKAGFVMNRQKIHAAISEIMEDLENVPVPVEFTDDLPHADPASADEAVQQARQMIKKAIALEYDETLTITREQIGSWIISDYRGDRLVPEIDREQVIAYVAKIAGKVNRPAGQPKFSFQDGRVTEFVPPHPGRALDEEKILRAILDELYARRDGEKSVERVIPTVQENSQSVMQLPIVITKSAGDIPANLQGITELIGKATTPFTGSPPNRINNIKNGVKFLTGVIIPPGGEFSTLDTLGVIDNTSGYLPELVIKGDRTLPEFGGGLCQVSTTLFRAVLNSGLPVTSRRNHSYRVSYYEWDGTGQYIGPGLDATIYEPNPDFKFKNDTATAVLIYGYVTSNKVTFELYGTKDGRVAKVTGPKTLTQVPSGEPIYEETSLLAKGVTKQVEKPHPGGTATATYDVTYADGRTVSQKFFSSYRPWPARFLVGTGEVAATPTPVP